jgi:drug/metabolite transporter (DMT)-like permease
LEQLLPQKVSFLTGLAIFGTVVLWGSAFVGIRYSLADYSPFHLALLRFLVASAVLVVFAVAGRVRLPSARDLPLIVLTGFSGIGFYNLVLNYGAMTVNAGSTSFIISTAPIMTSLIAYAFLGERISPLGWCGMLISLMGVGLIAFGQGDSFQFESGALFVFVAAFSTSIFFVVQKPLLKKYNSVEVTCYSIWIGTLILLPFAGGLASEIAHAPLSSTLSVVYLGVFPAALAYLFWSYALSRLTASRSVSFLYMIPVAATLLAYLIIDEIPGALAAAGGCTSLLGVVLLNTFGRIKARSE